MPESQTSRWRLVAALATVYLVWGSTYLAIRFAVETLPPFLMAAARFVSAGAVLWIWCARRGDARPTARQWGNATLIGGLLLLGGNGVVSWAEKTVPSGLTALLIATVPVWMVAIEALRPGGRRPTLGVVLGLALGLVGIFLLVGPSELAGGERVDPVGALALILASLSWALGSIASSHLDMPRRPLQSTAMQMLAGGALLVGLGTALGEWGDLDLAAVSARSVWSVVYLAVFGSIVAFSAYVWLLRNTSPAVVGTYAFVNPVVAVALGWALAGEPLHARTLIATAVIVAGVVLITARRRRPPPPCRESRPPEQMREAA